MSSASLQIECPNIHCLHPANALGQTVCDRCQTPLVYRYLWAMGDEVALIAPGSRMGDRYLVTTSQIWLDLQPGRSPDPADSLPEIARPYLHLIAHRLHIPTVFGVYLQQPNSPIVLLEHAALTPLGQLLPAIEHLWVESLPVRRLNWLWQLLNLWQPLREQGVASSLLHPETVRVEGWRICLRELIPDSSEPTLADLGQCWSRWLNLLAETIGSPTDSSPTGAASSTDILLQQLRDLCTLMQSTEAEATILQTVKTNLNQLLLEQAAQLPLQVSLASMTATGPQRTHNEDACYPGGAIAPTTTITGERLQPRLGIVCDGIGGHAGGEVASQMAIRSLELQLLTLLAETAEQNGLVSPAVVSEQLKAALRVVNNMIATQNDQQGRELRQRMGTTVVLGMQLPQPVSLPAGTGNSHELYITHVGDSRAYWITPRYCHLLTLDDDIATREVKLGHSTYRDALHRPDAGALTQALGTREADVLDPVVQRLVVDEDGVLLLCSDGLSDDELVERSWRDVTQPLFKDKASLEKTAQAWIDLANQHNGHDNASVVLLRCQVNPSSFRPEPPPTPLLEEVPAANAPGSTLDQPVEELSESSRALLYDEQPPPVAQPTSSPPKPSSRQRWSVSLLVFIITFLLGGAGVFAWSQLAPDSFQRTLEPFRRDRPPQ